MNSTMTVFLDSATVARRIQALPKTCGGAFPPSKWHSYALATWVTVALLEPGGLLGALCGQTFGSGRHHRSRRVGDGDATIGAGPIPPGKLDP